MNEQEFRRRIISRREELGLSQQELADKVGLGWKQKQVSQIESGDRKIDAIEELPRLADALKVTINWFYERPYDYPAETPAVQYLRKWAPGYEFPQHVVDDLDSAIEAVGNIVLRYAGEYAHEIIEMSAADQQEAWKHIEKKNKAKQERKK